MPHPLLLDDAAIETVTTAIREGCYDTVAAGRVGISRYCLRLWQQRGKREADDREERMTRGEPADEPESIYERLYRATETAMAVARYGAETRVYRTQPLQWLRSGHARNDWRESDQFVRAVSDAVDERIKQMVEQALNPATADPTRLTNEQLGGVLYDLLRVQLVNDPAMRQTLLADLQQEPSLNGQPALAERSSHNGHTPVTPTPPV